MAPTTHNKRLFNTTVICHVDQTYDSIRNAERKVRPAVLAVDLALGHDEYALRYNLSLSATSTAVELEHDYQTEYTRDNHKRYNEF